MESRPHQVPNAQQILEAEGHILLTGGPGSGKTTMGLRVAATRSSDLLPQQRILFLSFSKAAILRLVQASKTELTHVALRSVEFHTFHSFFWRLLRSFGQYAGVGVPTRLMPPEYATAGKNEHPTSWIKRSVRMARTEGRMVFNLFAPFAIRTLRKQPEILKLLSLRYPIIVIDEFQDTDDHEFAFTVLAAERSKIVCLGDPFQRIYDFRPGVRANRLDLLKSAISPVTFDLAQQNHRSPTVDLLAYADAVLSTDDTPVSCGSVAVITYQYLNQIGVKLKYLLLNTRKQLRKSGVQKPSIAIVAATNRMVQRLSHALSKPTRKAQFTIEHEIELDDDELIMAWRFLCLSLSAQTISRDEYILQALECLADFHIVRGGVTNLNSAARLRSWKAAIEEGGSPRTPLIPALESMHAEIETLSFRGIPHVDVGMVAQHLAAVDSQYVAAPVALLALSLPFRNSDHAEKRLRSEFEVTSTYRSAPECLEDSTSYQRLIGAYRLTPAFILMTIHKCKGKEFDAIIVVDGIVDPDRLVGFDDPAPHTASRTLLRVALSRARRLARVLTPHNDPSPILPALV